MSVRYKVAVIGAAETTELGVIPEMTGTMLAADAALNAIADSGIEKDKIDGVFGTESPIVLAHYLGITPRFIDGTSVGGTSYLIHVRHAAMAIAAGYCNYALVAMGESGRSRVGTRGRAVPQGSSLNAQFESIYGAFGPPTLFGMGILRYMKQYGLTSEQLAYVAVAQRKWAAKVPRAMMREPITVEDVLNSRMICYPLHLLECCLVTDGGGAIILTSAERARDFPKKPVYLLGGGEAAETPMIAMMEDFTSSKAFRISSSEAFAEAQIGHSDVDHLMCYDAFAHLPIFMLEDLGFVGRGEAGAFIAAGNTEPGGKLPMNTNGGGLSYTHTGMYGMFAMQEALRQLRGEAARQVANARVSFVQGVGGMFGAAGSLVFTNEPPH